MEITNATTQTVAAGGNVLFTDTPVQPSGCIQHREGSGIVTLRGVTNQCRARFLARFSANIAIPSGGTVEEISAAISLNGEPLPATAMRVTPAAVSEYFNVSGFVYVDVPKGCCQYLSIENTSGQAIEVANANLIVTREA